MSQCPTNEQLVLLLAEQLGDAEAGLIEEHVQGCSRCQDALEKLSAAEPPPAGLRLDPAASRTGLDPSPQFVHHLTENMPATLTEPAAVARIRAAALAAGERGPEVTGYEIIAELGRGGMGVVYKARHLRLGRVVALKMLLAGAHAGPQELARFRAEAEAVARLQHPNIVQIFEVGEENGCPYLALEYIDGESLSRRLKTGPPPVKEAARLLEVLARAIDAAHRRGVIHRDLKPANVLVLDDGTPKITDFSLAKLLDAATAHTRSGVLLGTPDYMSPEQAGGQHVGPAADIHGLGAILYHLLTGRAPFAASTPLDTLVRLQSEEPISPSMLQPALPRDLVTICLKCLEKDPRQRYASALDLADDLLRFHKGEPIRARPTSTWERARKWIKRRPAMAALLAVSAVACLAVVGGSVALWYGGQLRTALEDAERQRLLAEAERGEADRQRQRAQEFELRVRYVHDMNAGQRQWQEAYMGPLIASLDDWRPTPAQPLDLRSWDWGYLHHLCHLELRQLNLMPYTFMAALAFSPDGRLMAGAAREGKAVLIWDVDVAQPRVLAGHTGSVESVAFHPNSRLVASGSEDGTIKLWDAIAGKALRTLRGHTGGIRGVAFSPDGHRLASAGMDCTVRLWDVDSGKQLALYAGHERFYVLAVAFSTDGKRLASAGRGKDIHICDAGSGTLIQRLRGHQFQVSGLDFSVDGKMLASASEDRTIKLWDCATGKERATLTGHGAWVARALFTPDGRYLASAADDGTVRLWNVASGKEVNNFRGDPLRYTHALAVHPSGRWLASATNLGVRVWPVEEGPPDMRILRGHRAPIVRISFSPDSRTLVSTGMDHTARLWDVATAKEKSMLEVHNSRAPAVFRADGSQLASVDADGAIRLWDAATGRALAVLAKEQGAVTCVFRPGGRLVASGHRDGKIKLWDTDSARELWCVAAHAAAVDELAFSADGRWLASLASDASVKTWNATSGAAVGTVHGPVGKHYAIALSPDGRRVALANTGSIDVRDPFTGQRLRVLRGHASEVYHVAFSPDGRRLASGGADRTARVWDLETGLETLTFAADSMYVYTVAFSPDSRYLAAGGVDTTIKLWEADPIE
ncbi:MAG TPA: protein kinase [Gemmataceae bacterium]|nr:protein kinase [Gemmataceae bacterium]